MPEEDTNEALNVAKVLFNKAEKAAQRGDFDEAIDRYVEGLRVAPDAVAEGHIKLRDMSGARYSKGGEKATEEEIKQRMKGETALERMLGAEYLLAKDPVHLAYAEAMLKAGVEGGFRAAGKWIADLMFSANNRAKKPSIRLYRVLKDSYAGIGELDRAVAACESAVKVRPEDEGLAAELSEMSRRRAVVEAEREDEELELSLESVEEEPGRVGGGGIEGGRLGEEEADPAVARARDLFSKARQVAASNNLDYAIEMYLQGLRHQPDWLEEGHLALCQLALQRQKKGGKKPTMMEKVKRLRGKTDLEQMLNAEYLFAKDPSHLPYAGQMLRAAVAGGYKRTANWIANYLFQENNASEKPSFQIYALLKESYRSLGQYDKALAACQRSAQLKPNDADLADELKNLTAEMTMVRGKYDQEGDFTKAIKDRESQDRLHSQESVVKTRDYREVAVKEARKALAAEPELARNIYNLAAALADLDEDKAEDEAIELLEETSEKKQDFSFAQRAGEIRMKQLRRKVREAKSALEGKGEDAAAKAKVEELSERLSEVELEHYGKCVKNYPTDLQVKYEYGVRLLGHKRYDEAIPLLQDAQKDPRHKISAMDKIGLCFFKKGWYADSVDVFKQAIEAYQIKDDRIANELRYNLARAYEEQGQTEQALEIYRKIAQLDFGFRDVRGRVDKLRGQ